jgi:hypothetical protein
MNLFEALNACEHILTYNNVPFARFGDCGFACFEAEANSDRGMVLAFASKGDNVTEITTHLYGCSQGPLQSLILKKRIRYALRGTTVGQPVRGVSSLSTQMLVS